MTTTDSTDAKLLIIVVTYNGLQDIDMCLSSVDAQNPLVEGMVIDNASTDGTVEHIRKNFPNIKLVVNEKNIGFGAANNIGLRYALKNNFDYVYLLNQDAWITPREIERMIQVSRAHPEVAVFSPLQVWKNNDKLDHGFSLCLDFEIKNDYILGNPVKDIYFVKPQKTIQAAHWLVPCEALRKIGGFSPAFYHYGEDNNLCQRVSYWGYKAGLVPDCRGVHNREGRRNNKEKELYLLCQSWKYILSNPNYLLRYNIVKVSISMYETFCGYKFKSVPYMFKALKCWRTIVRNRRLSMKEGAFLSEEQS